MARLRVIATRPETVWFVGSGASVGAGLPTWSQLIEQLADFLDSLGISSESVRKEHANRDYLQAASYGYFSLDDSEQLRFLRSAIRIDEASPSELHNAIAATPGVCFVTTNFDGLLEEALRAQRGARAFRTILGSQTLELASIVHARAKDFVFKPHGDALTHDSIVLTKEHYREMLGRRRNVAEAMRTLLISRPVIYVGFGLRDPDFGLAMDSLSTTFDSFPQDHFALMAGVSEEEIRYWRTKQGIHLIPYENSDGTHSQLVRLIESLGDKTASARDRSVQPAGDSTLAILRYLAAHLAGHKSGQAYLPLSGVISDDAGAPSRPGERIQDVPSMLASSKFDWVLAGPPGSGKSTAISNAARFIAVASRDKILSGEIGDYRDIRVPIVLSLREYGGDFSALVRAQVPDDFPLEQLISLGSIVLFLDGANEVPQPYLENDQFREALSELRARFGECVVVVSTRFPEEWSSLGLPTVSLSDLTRESVQDEISTLNIGTVPSTPVMDMLRRPLFLRMVLDGAIDLTALDSVHGLYAALLLRWNSFIRPLSEDLDLMQVIPPIAHELLESGSQFVDSEVIYESLGSLLNSRQVAVKVLDALLQHQLVVADAAGRVAFWHHSLVEYFAAHELARRLDAGAEIDAYLAQRSWDHAVLLGLGFMTPERAHQTISRMLHVDVSLVMRGLWYLEQDQVQWSKSVLDYLADNSETLDHRLISLNVPLRDELRDALNTLSATPSMLGGAALASLYILEFESTGQSAGYSRLLERHGDYNYGGEFARTIAETMSDLEFMRLLEEVSEDPLLADLHIPTDADDNVAHGIINAIEELAVTRSNAVYRNAVETYLSRSEVIRSGLIRAADKIGDEFAVNLLVEQTISGAMDAAFHLYLHLRFQAASEVDDKTQVAIASAVLNRLAQSGEVNRWSLELLGSLSSPGVNDILRANAAIRGGISRAALLIIAGDDNEAVAVLRGWLAGSQTPDQHRSDWASVLFGSIDWGENSDLIDSILASGDEVLVRELSESLAYMDVAPQFEANLPNLGLHLDWLEVQVDSWLKSRVGMLIGSISSDDVRTQLVAEFRKTGSTERKRMLAEFVLPHLSDISIRDLGRDAVDWLIADALKHGVSHWRVPLLALVTSETEVRDRLVPLLGRSLTENERSAVRMLLDHCATRHSTRFVDDQGQALISTRLDQ